MCAVGEIGGPSAGTAAIQKAGIDGHGPAELLIDRNMIAVLIDHIFGIAAIPQLEFMGDSPFIV